MKSSLLICVVLVAALSCCSTGLSADEYRFFAVTGWSAGFLNQSQVNNLLGIVGDPNSKGQIREANCNAVVVEVRRRADVCYPSAVGEPYMSGLTPSNFNALQAMINAAHDTTGGKKRIEVHCWIVVFRTGDGEVHDEHDDPADPANYWVTCNSSGNEPSDYALDPGHPNAEEYTVNVCMDLVNNFDIDGLHFDYVRFTGTTQGYNPTSVQRFNTWFNRTGQPDSGDEVFKQWRRDQVTSVVRKVYAKIQASKPNVKLSGSFIGGSSAPATPTREAFYGTSAYANCYSDWDSWVQEGIVDFAAPMLYFDMDQYATAWSRWLSFCRERKANRFIAPHVGIYQNYLQDAIDQLLETRNPSSGGKLLNGFGGYSYQAPYSTIKDSEPGGPVYGSWSTFKTQLLAQVTPTWADVPVMPWKISPTKGHVGGTVTFAPGGAWADGALVRISGPDTRQMRCDGTGFYAFIDLTPGLYTITANYGAFEDTKTVTVSATPGIANGDIYLHTPDVTPPVVSNVQVTEITDSAAVVTWTTDELCNSQVEYDSVPYYGQSSDVDGWMTTTHTITLQGLTPSTAYHCRVKSTNGAGLSGYSTDLDFTTTAVQTTITIDETDPECYKAGPWIKSTSSSGYDGDYYYVSSANSGTATFTPVLPRSGLYDVLAYYVEGANRSTQALYTVNYAGGSNGVTVNQRQDGNNWTVYLGTNVQFEMGTSGSVVLSNPNADGNVIADAVRWIYKGDVTAPIMTSASIVSTQGYVTSTSTLQASWAGYDNESGVTKYKYCVGTQPGLADVKVWTDVGTSTGATISGLSLQYNHTYYVSARAVNGAGLTSNPWNSTGVTVARIVANAAEAKGCADGDVVSFTAAKATAGFTGRFYIEDLNRVSGLRVESTTAVSPNQSVQVFGTLGIANGCERSLLSCKVVPGSTGSVLEPLTVTTKYAGGAGVTSGRGLNNMGLLVRVAGKVSKTVSDGFYLDDGSGLADETGYVGIKVWTGAPNSAVEDSYVSVTGVISARQNLGTTYPLVLKRDIH